MQAPLHMDIKQVKQRQSGQSHYIEAPVLPAMGVFVVNFIILKCTCTMRRTY